MFFMTTNKIKAGADPKEVEKVMPQHIQWTKKLITEGKIVQAGKWGDSGGMAIMRAADMTEAENILSNDPLIQSGLITFELARLYPDVEIK